ncbi:MAG: ATP-binding cassette domain-containing protein [Actinomycetota bacterium]|nr:MAG: cobalt/nickel transport system ATP-binding [Actinomycetota bacterium]MDO8949028.1 ATP-binding cassette domain-containing protein [Actinomycetota bacterium]MDP3630964.1 ATP-binding cassette domain-containing protein [Actinomycetota bacterium]
MALVAKDLGYTYSTGAPYESRALTGVDLRLEKGELCLVVGSTGSGKSTLLRLMSGLLEPGVGSVRVDDAESVVRGSVGIVFQNPETQFFAETVSADVAFGPKNLGFSDVDTAVSDAMLAVGLEPVEFGERSPFTLSGGEARRAAIAGVLAMRPAYLLLDEPTAGLDRRGREVVVRALLEARLKAGVLLVTHDPGVFLAHADRVLVLAAGQPVFYGNVTDLLEDDGAPFDVAGLVLPDVVRAQVLARSRGARIARFAFDATDAARTLAGALGGPS